MRVQKEGAGGAAERIDPTVASQDDLFHGGAALPRQSQVSADRVFHGGEITLESMPGLPAQRHQRLAGVLAVFVLLLRNLMRRC